MYVDLYIFNILRWQIHECLYRSSGCYSCKHNCQNCLWKSHISSRNSLNKIFSVLVKNTEFFTWPSRAVMSQQVVKLRYYSQLSLVLAHCALATPNLLSPLPVFLCMLFFEWFSLRTIILPLSSWSILILTSNFIYSETPFIHECKQLSLLTLYSHYTGI